MAGQLLSLPLLCLVAAIHAEPAPAPGRAPKVYNALITSNQNLEPSKAYPVYQPVIHDAYAFPFQPIFYGTDFRIPNGLLPAPALAPKIPNEKSPSVSPPAESVNNAPSTEAPPTSPPQESSPQPSNEEAPSASTPSPPLPPNTESPIPLNEFGLPPHVLPLGRLDPAFDGFTHIGPFTYNYPSFRFYDPYDPFALNPYTNFPALYRPLGNVLTAGPVLVPGREVIPTSPAASPAPAQAASSQQTAQTPPPEPNDLNILNYSSKDPAIPNVPPPPIPQGGLKSDNTE